MKNFLKMCLSMMVFAFVVVALSSCGGNGKTTGYSSDELDGGAWPISEYVWHVSRVGVNLDGELVLGAKGFYMEGLNYANSDATPSDGDLVVVCQKEDEYFLYLGDPDKRDFPIIQDAKAWFEENFGSK